MRTAYFLLLGLIGVSPVFLFLDGMLEQAFVVAFAAITTTLVVAFIAPGEAGHLGKVVRPVVIAAAIVAVWLLVQLIPLPKSLANAIWSDAQSALGAWIPGTITINAGATVVAICRFCSAFALVIVAAAITIHRDRSGTVLLWLLAAASVVAVLQVLDALI